jgi:phosphinothricin acetyltransferase
MDYRVRRAEPGDIDQVVEILNQGVSTRHSIGYFEPQTVDQMRSWYKEYLVSARYPILLAEDLNGRIDGWISLSPYRKGREAFSHTGEISAYVRDAARRKGVAQLLVDSVLNYAAEHGFRTIFAIVLHRNLASVAFLEKNRFERWAFLPDVAEIDGVLLSHIYFGRRLL